MILKIILVIFILFGICSCKEDPAVAPPPHGLLKDSITVKVEETTQRQITLSIHTTQNNPGSTIELYRVQGTSVDPIAEYPVSVSDTIIVDDNRGNGLIINTEYRYYAVRKTQTGERPDTSNTEEAITLGPASLNYTWQEFELGNGDAASVLYDVWGTDENNVYACGIVFYNDTVYGIVKWNGNEWTPFSKSAGGVSIHGFSGNDIWVVAGGVHHYNGIEWKQIDSYTSGIQSVPLDSILFDNLPYSSVWGTSSSNVYFGNIRGEIVHWNGSKAELVYSHESNVHVKDLSGYSQDYIIGVGFSLIPPLLAVGYNGSSWNKLPITDDPSLNSVAVISKDKVYFGGSGIHEMKNGSLNQIYSSGYYIWDIEYDRKTGILAACGVYDGIYINNGLEWKNYRTLVSTDETTYAGVYLAGETVFCVGLNGLRAKIAIGKRIN